MLESFCIFPHSARLLREVGQIQMSDSQAERFDVVVVGAGFAGLYALHRLRGLGLSVRVFEAGSGIGGTWFWNRYPGARCDVESLQYSYQFSEALQQEWEWSERYATQAEILDYIHHVAERFDLRRDVQLGTRVVSAVFDQEAGCWTVETEPAGRFSAQYCVMATGCLSSANLPRLPGLEDFSGARYHTGQWPHEAVDFAGKRVGVIGTGSSAIQSIPLIAKEAEHLFVFQRTPNYSVPAHNGPLDPRVVEEVKADYPGFRARNSQTGFGLDTRARDESALAVSAEEREVEYEARWQRGGLPFISSFNDLGSSKEANDTAAEFLRRKIREIVSDPELAELLSPDQVVGCKRLCVDTAYFETFNRPNVTLVDLRSAPIEAITRAGLRSGGVEYALDCIVFATGFDAMTGALLRVDIRGRSGQTLRDKWSAGPRTYLGLATAGFPNLFLITGPGSPSVLSNMIPSIEQHVNWIADCVEHMRERGSSRIEATVGAEDAWVAHVNEVAGETLYPSCNSWYLGANVPGKPRVFMPYLGFPPYVEKCNEVASRGYEGFALSG
jgi:cation diffusion facilitator CzcD-associated flavoprotein CzcO